MRYGVISGIKTLVITLTAGAAVAALLIFSGAVTEGVKSGLTSAAQILIPSLFPFMVISSFLIRSGALDRPARLLAPINGFLFRLPRDASVALILSFLGGFPVGAKCVRLLYDEGKIDSAQAEQMMTFCVCSGPAFLVTGVGTLLLHESLLGLILYLSQVLSGIILGIVSGRIYSHKKGISSKESHRSKAPKAKVSPLEAFVMSCSDGAVSIIGLSAMVALFGVIISLCEVMGISELLSGMLGALGADIPLSQNILYVILEVTRACSSIGSGGCPLWLFSFAVGFGGLCVHFQIFSILGDIPLSKLRFFVFRLMNAFLSSVIVYIVCLFYQPDREASLTLGGFELEYGAVSATGAAALVLMCVIFVLSLRIRSTKN